MPEIGTGEDQTCSISAVTTVVYRAGDHNKNADALSRAAR